MRSSNRCGAYLRAFCWPDLAAANFTLVLGVQLEQRAHINAMRHVLSLFHYGNKDYGIPGEPGDRIVSRARKTLGE